MDDGTAEIKDRYVDPGVEFDREDLLNAFVEEFDGDFRSINDTLANDEEVITEKLRGLVFQYSPQLLGVFSSIKSSLDNVQYLKRTAYETRNIVGHLVSTNFTSKILDEASEKHCSVTMSNVLHESVFSANSSGRSRRSRALLFADEADPDEVCCHGLAEPVLKREITELRRQAASRASASQQVLADLEEKTERCSEDLQAYAEFSDSLTESFRLMDNLVFDEAAVTLRKAAESSSGVHLTRVLSAENALSTALQVNIISLPNSTIQTVVDHEVVIMLGLMGNQLMSSSPLFRSIANVYLASQAQKMQQQLKRITSTNMTAEGIPQATLATTTTVIETLNGMRKMFTTGGSDPPPGSLAIIASWVERTVNALRTDVVVPLLLTSRQATATAGPDGDLEKLFQILGSSVFAPLSKPRLSEVAGQTINSVVSLSQIASSGFAHIVLSNVRQMMVSAITPSIKAYVSAFEVDLEAKVSALTFDGLWSKSEPKQGVDVSELSTKYRRSLREICKKMLDRGDPDVLTRKLCEVVYPDCLIPPGRQNRMFDQRYVPSPSPVAMFIVSATFALCASLGSLSCTAESSQEGVSGTARNRISIAKAIVQDPVLSEVLDASLQQLIISLCHYTMTAADSLLISRPAIKLELDSSRHSLCDLVGRRSSASNDRYTLLGASFSIIADLELVRIMLDAVVDYFGERFPVCQHLVSLQSRSAGFTESMVAKLLENAFDVNEEDEDDSDSDEDDEAPVSALTNFLLQARYVAPKYDEAHPRPFVASTISKYPRFDFDAIDPSDEAGLFHLAVQVTLNVASVYHHLTGNWKMAASPESTTTPAPPSLHGSGYEAIFVARHVNGSNIPRASVSVARVIVGHLIANTMTAIRSEDFWASVGLERIPATLTRQVQLLQQLLKETWKAFLPSSLINQGSDDNTLRKVRKLQGVNLATFSFAENTSQLDEEDDNIESSDEITLDKLRHALESSLC